MIQNAFPVRRLNRQFVRRWLAGLAITGILAGPPNPVLAGGDHDSANRVVHVVLIWLKDPGNPQHRREIIEAGLAFTDIPGVIEVRVGESLDSDRDVVDDSFDVGMYMTFASVKEMNAYLANPAHVEAVRETLGPITDHYVVYDFIAAGN